MPFSILCMHRRPRKISMSTIDTKAWRKSSSGIWCRVVVVRTDVSEERIASIFRGWIAKRIQWAVGCDTLAEEWTQFISLSIQRKRLVQASEEVGLRVSEVSTHSDTSLSTLFTQGYNTCCAVYLFHVKLRITGKLRFIICADARGRLFSWPLLTPFIRHSFIVFKIIFVQPYLPIVSQQLYRTYWSRRVGLIWRNDFADSCLWYPCPTAHG
jgi:hypothetical protein